MHTGAGEGELSDCRRKKDSRATAAKHKSCEVERQIGVMGITKMGMVALTNCTGEVTFAAVPKQDKTQLFIYPTCQGNAQKYTLQLQAEEHCHGVPRTRQKNAFLDQ